MHRAVEGDEALTAQDVGREAKMPLPSVYAAIRNGKLRARNVAPGDGVVLRVMRSDLEKFLGSEYHYTPKPRTKRSRRG